MSLNLANAYRPHDWESVVGQEYTKTILRNALSSDRVGTGYIFHGTRGTGKTTSARILAEGINCLDLQNGNPCHICANCVAFENGNFLDVIEIDAASNTGVDNIRELIDTARFQPNQGKYKIYIIDEVHMLSKGAFNALLKILEEPPAHVKFILATTEIEKVPETIRSRTQRFDFRKIAQEDIADQLEKICKTEGIEADRNALMLIARLAKGALRDAITLLEQNRVNDTITREHIMHTLSMVDEAILKNVVQGILAGDLEKMKNLLTKLSHAHIQVRIFVEEILFFLRDDCYAENDTNLWNQKMRIFDGLNEMYGKIKYTPDTFLLLEMTLLRLTREGNPSPDFSHNSRTNTNQNLAPKSGEIEKDISGKTEERKIPEKENIPKSIPLEEKKEEVGTASETKKDFSFSQFVALIRAKKPALALDLKETKFRVEDTTLILISTSELRHGRLMTPEHRAIIQDVLTEFVGATWKYQNLLETEVNPLQKAVDDVF